MSVSTNDSTLSSLSPISSESSWSRNSKHKLKKAVLNCSKDLKAPSRRNSESEMTINPTIKSLQNSASSDFSSDSQSVDSTVINDLSDFDLDDCLFEKPPFVTQKDSYQSIKTAYSIFRCQVSEIADTAALLPAGVNSLSPLFHGSQLTLGAYICLLFDQRGQSSSMGDESMYEQV